MKAKELQLGDYVDYRGRIIKVTSLYDKGVVMKQVGVSKKTHGLMHTILSLFHLKRYILQRMGLRPENTLMIQSSIITIAMR